MAEIASSEVKTDLQHRLRRIEGQARGVQRMIDEGRDCKSILQQLAAIRSAAHQASLVLVRSYATQCLSEPWRGEPSPTELVNELVGVLAKIA
ncbi:MAG: metal-sensitive transcriptional regulator [Chloroflexi bacterium]|nr:metal-sensitive transcriptional regulator [Chloroflexota bacterium]